jgi:hypothetical protein
MTVSSPPEALAIGRVATQRRRSLKRYFRQAKATLQSSTYAADGPERPGRSSSDVLRTLRRVYERFSPNWGASF